MSSVNPYPASPLRPVPQFFESNNSFTTKKERYSSTPCPKRVPPRPPSKTVPPISRFFAQPKHQTAQAISFKENSDISLSKHYDSSREESYFDQCFIVEKKIGSGSFGDVFRVKSREDGKYYAIKRSRERFKGKSDRERKLEEVCKHEQLPKHPNCVRLYKAWEERQHLYIQTELCETSLSDFTEVNHEIPEHIVCNYFVDLLKAVGHLHDHNLMHLDIKPDNIFISRDGLCKLGDFGLVLDLNKYDSNEATEGDPKYLAKELMSGHFTKAADIFSLGVSILEIACDLDLPSGGEVWHQLRDGKIPDILLSGISTDLREIIKDMMNPDYRLRPSVDQLLNHPFIRRIERSRRWKLRAKRSLKPTDTSFVKSPNNSLNISHNDFDNYSDDDMFETSYLSVLDNSLDKSSNFEDKHSSPDNSFDKISKRKFCSTSVVNRRKTGFDLSFRSPSFATSSPIQRMYNTTLPDSPTLFRESSITCKPLISQKLNFDDQSGDESSDCDKIHQIGPKNLLSTFDEIENDSSD
ncbi:membrane-associated tyrosine- and threonine-specific cdc2-inhibitory kinase-like isoform X2 [Oppia nitens]|uniref:membrane-associated tyrosine- and threonine-specific cdc2-inhibitory kinase-like isoform X2 n=1 Tax=Oppia nitens TaxID=1686743 RepID=UPI0023DA0423|nr:membrane-associated tyrosine- and threonine-specific cdc2-inhibitory kinase-like isoform X2 [Oppia nitens]